MTPTENSAGTQHEATSAFSVLVPVDGSDLAASALPVAVDLCRKLGGELVLVRVVPPVVWPHTLAAGTVGAGYESPGTYEQLQEDAESDAREYLERMAAGVRAEGVAVTTRLGGGDPGTGLLDVIASQPVALVVMTTHGRTGLARAVLGSVADQVVRSGKAPVLLLRSSTAPASEAAPSGTQQSTDLSRALVPLDGTEIAETPLFTIGLRLAGPVLREITLLRVVDPKAGAEGWSSAEAYLDALRQRVIERLEEQGRDCAVSRITRWGSDPAAAIVERSQTDGCDLVLMATHSAAGIGRVVFGDVTDRVLREGKTPLLLMHPPHS